MLDGSRTVCTQIETHPVTQGDKFCDQCGAATKQVADGATQLAAHTTETRLLRFKCGRCSTQVGNNATICPHCNARFGIDVDIIDYGQKSMKDKGQWSEPVVAAAAFVPQGPIPGGAFDKSLHQPAPQKRPWLLILLASVLGLSLVIALAFAAYMAGRANQAEQALAAMPTDAAIIVLPPSPTPTDILIPTAEPTNQAQPTQASAIAPTAVPTVAAQPTDIPDARPQITAGTVLHNGTPSGAMLAQLQAGDRFSPSFWMNVGGHVYYFITAEPGNGWIDSDATDISTNGLKELVLVQGITGENANRGYITDFGGRMIAFIFTDGTYEARVALPDRDGEWVAITNGDFLMVEKREGTSIFFRTNSNIIDGDPARNIAGVLPEWVVTGVNVPPAPTAAPTVTSGGSNSDGPAKIYDAWRYKYNVGVAEVNNGHSRIKVQVVFPKGYDQYLTRSIGFVIGDSLSYGVGGGQSDVGNGGYDVRLVQFKDGAWAELSLIHVEVRNGITNVVTFTGTTTKLR